MLWNQCKDVITVWGGLSEMVSTYSVTQQRFACSKLTLEILERGLKSVEK